MKVFLTPELEHWVDERVRSGRYAAASEVIREAFRLREGEEAAKQRRIGGISRKIDHGLEQMEDGKGVSSTLEEKTLRPVGWRATFNIGLTFHLRWHLRVYAGLTQRAF